jgi:hypothetical protein
MSSLKAPYPSGSDLTTRRLPSGFCSVFFGGRNVVLVLTTYLPLLDLLAFVAARSIRDMVWIPCGYVVALPLEHGGCSHRRPSTRGVASWPVSSTTTTVNFPGTPPSGYASSLTGSTGPIHGTLRFTPVQAPVAQVQLESSGTPPAAPHAP